mmetsp:Transcript_9047/g.23641  ORF Transcript_9047/g.23641 Transcript_9047/m.23641 type:complete len:461 (-) Transcript_9047:1024-2406(-)
MFDLVIRQPRRQRWLRPGRRRVERRSAMPAFGRYQAKLPPGGDVELLPRVSGVAPDAHALLPARLLPLAVGDGEGVAELLLVEHDRLEVNLADVLDVGRRDIVQRAKLALRLGEIAVDGFDKLLSELLEVKLRLAHRRRLPADARHVHPKPQIEIHLGDAVDYVLGERAHGLDRHAGHLFQPLQPAALGPRGLQTGHEPALRARVVVGGRDLAIDERVEVRRRGGGEEVAHVGGQGELVRAEREAEEPSDGVVANGGGWARGQHDGFLLGHACDELLLEGAQCPRAVEALTEVFDARGAQRAQLVVRDARARLLLREGHHAIAELALNVVHRRLEGVVNVCRFGAHDVPQTRALQGSLGCVHLLHPHILQVLRQSITIRFDHFAPCLEHGCSPRSCGRLRLRQRRGHSQLSEERGVLCVPASDARRRRIIILQLRESRWLWAARRELLALHRQRGADEIL